MNGEVESREQSRTIVVESELAFVEVGNGPREREAKAGALVGSARIQAAEAAQRLLPAVERDARTAIRDLDSDSLVAALDAHTNLAAIGAVTDRIFEQIAERLREKLPMSEQWRGAVWLLELQRSPA